MKRWSKKRIALIWFISLCVLMVFFSLLPGATYTDAVTGENTWSGLYSIPSLVISIAFTYFLIKQHNKKASTYSRDNEELCLRLAKNVIWETGQASVSMLERKLNIDYLSASKLMVQLENEGFVSRFDGTNPREILVSKSNHKSEAGLATVDSMEGHDFEYWCADLLRKIGFINVEVTPGSGDQGVDILAEKDGIKYAIQCKCYSKDLGNTPIQEVEAGKVYYGCHVGAVMTNRYFTCGARELAKKTGTLLWDRDFISKADVAQ